MTPSSHPHKQPILILLLIIILASPAFTQITHTISDCTDADQVLCKKDCTTTVIRCTGPGSGIEFTIQGSGLIKCSTRYNDGSSEPSFILSTACTPGTAPAGVQAATPRICAVKDNATTPEIEAQFAETVRVIENQRQFGQFASSISGVFNVYFHVVYPSEGHVAKLSAQTIQRQIDVLNSDYRTYKFQVAQVIYYRNPTWFDWVNQDSTGMNYQTQMKQQTRKGDKRDLNVWSVGFTKYRSILGYSTFPQDYKYYPWNDGVVIHYASVPGGSIGNYNLGRTLTHEAGHWLGLLHTFQGGCYGSGDGVDDTPFEASGASGCPIGRNTCPTQPGNDPVRNFMDYSYDSCMNEFTQGQYYRMAAAIAMYRT
ncbi:hypothetical protein HDU97_001885 [Phlyctochytrium planicorne]|nr:hypothetical protein HDU97_001885 [Phlyctochytrium planicorne]